jgi:hypothetical protein
MYTLLQIRNAVEGEIRAAFRGVTLGQGISLRQAELIDSRKVTPASSSARGEIRHHGDDGVSFAWPHRAFWLTPLQRNGPSVAA